MLNYQRVNMIFPWCANLQWYDSPTAGWTPRTAQQLGLSFPTARLAHGMTSGLVQPVMAQRWSILPSFFPSKNVSLSKQHLTLMFFCMTCLDLINPSWRVIYIYILTYNKLIFNRLLYAYYIYIYIHMFIKSTPGVISCYNRLLSG